MIDDIYIILPQKYWPGMYLQEGIEEKSRIDNKEHMFYNCTHTIPQSANPVNLIFTKNLAWGSTALRCCETLENFMPHLRHEIPEGRNTFSQKSLFTKYSERMRSHCPGGNVLGDWGMSTNKFCTWVAHRHCLLQ